jgi:hypothetical protein
MIRFRFEPQMAIEDTGTNVQFYRVFWNRSFGESLMHQFSQRPQSDSAATWTAAHPVHTSIALVRRYARRILCSAPALLVAALWLSTQASAQTTHVAKPDVVKATITPCYGTCQLPVSCPPGSATTVTGHVYTPNGVDPLPNALVYVPNSAPDAFIQGVQCLVAGTTGSGNPVCDTQSATDGSFTLTNVPTGTNIPIVIQSGKWRFQGTIPTVTACVNTVAPSDMTSMPKINGATTTNGADSKGVGVGDIPQMALITGSVDAMECVLRQTGIADSEFTTSSGTGRIHLYTGDTSAGATLSGIAKESTLVGSAANLDKYDMVLFDCQGSPDTDADKSGTQTNLINYANAGGRIFGTHYNYEWFNNDPPFSQVANWNFNQSSLADGPATINTTFAGGLQLAQWLQDIGASTTLGHIAVNTTRHDMDGVVSPTQYWSTLDTGITADPHPVMQMTFNTPVGAAASAQCGRVLFNEYHVNNVSDAGQTFPSECTSNSPSSMTPQEKMLEYALFDLATAIVPVTSSSASQTYVNTPTVFTQGDGADQIAIDVTNTSGNGVQLSSSLTVNATLPSGVTVNTASFTSGGWTCATGGSASAFTCTRTTPLNDGASDTIYVPVAVASNAPTGTNFESLTSTITGGGLPTIVNGSDPLSIQGRPLISWPTPSPITYGTPLSSTQLDAVATCGGATVPGTYAYFYGSTPIAAGTILPVGTDGLSVTFTPTSPTTSCPVQTTTVNQVVNPAVLTVTANNLTKVYDTPNPTLTDTITGFVAGDTSAVVSGAAALSTTAVTASPVGSYPITAAKGTLAASNYTFVYVPGTLTVTKPAAAITWPTPAAITYGTPLSSTQLDAVATCGNVAQPVPGVYVYTPASGTILNAGTQTLSVTFTPTDIADCPVETTTVQQVVNKAPLVVTANSFTRAYDTANPTLTDSITGFVNGDSSTNLTGSAPMTTTAVLLSPVGAYPITFSSPTLANPNYSITYVNGTLTVSQAAGAITWPTPAAINYGTPLSSTQLNATATCGGVTVAGAYSYTPASGTVLNAGTQTLHVTFTPTDTTDCPVETTTVQQVVNKDVLTVTANNLTKTYGSANPTLTDAITGFVNSDTSAVVSGTAALSTTAVTTSPVGSYPITAALGTLSATNYTFQFVPGTLTVTQAAGAITWPTPAAINYGTPLSPTQLNASATCGGVTVPGVYSYTPASGAVLNSGTQTLSVTFTPTDIADCPVESTTVPLVVNKDVLTVTANNLTKTYGTANPTLTDAITGFVNGDTSAVVSGTPVLSTTAVTNSPVGSYPITAAQGTLSASNYTFAFVPGTLTVTQGVGAITWPTPAPITYGTPLSPTQLNAAATCGGVTVPGVYSYVPISGTILTAGSQTLHVTFTPTDTADCPVETTTVTEVVNPAPLVVTADNKTKVYNTTNPALTDTISGFVNGDTSASLTGYPNMSTTAITNSPVGSYPITFSSPTLANPNYSITYVNGTLTVTKPAETINWPVTSPITYGTTLVNELDATVTANGSQVPSVCTYKNGSTVLSSSTVLPAGTYSLTVSCVPNDTTDYTTQTTTATLVVSPAPLVVTADNKSKVFNTANPTLTDTITGFVNSDTSASLTGSANLSTTAVTNSPVGNYPISFSSPTLANPNYSITYVNGTLTVTQPNESINWPITSPITYGTNLNGELNAVVTAGGSTVPGVCTYKNGSTVLSTGTILPAGTYSLTVSCVPNDTTDYTTQTTTATLVVSPAPLVVTANNLSKTYGSPNPALSDSLAGLVNGDTSASLTGSANLTTTAVTNSPVGSYPITFSSPTLANPNYSITYVPGTLTVTQGTGAITWPTPAPITYGTPLGPNQLNAIATCGGVTVPGVYSYVPPAGTVLTVGSQTLKVTFTPTDTVDCPVETTTVTEVVNPATLVVTADNKSKPYNTANPTLTDSISGFVNGDNAASLTGSANLSTTAVTNSPVGSYPITFSSPTLANPNYSITYVNGTLTVTQPTESINWPITSPITYGTSLTGELNAVVTASGSTVPGVCTYKNGSTVITSATVLPVGSYTLSVSCVPNDTTDYTTQTTTATLVVKPAALTITANNLTKNFGSPNPTLTYTASGFVNGDTVASLTGTLALTTTAILNSPVVPGGYPINFVLPTPTDSNYTITYVPGTLTVLQGTGAITWPTPAAINYGTLLSSTQLDAVATCNGITVPGTYVYTPPAATLLNAGTYTLKVVFTPADSNSCPVESTTVQLVVNKLPTVTTVVPATPKPNPGQADKLTATVTGGLNETGTVVFTANGVTICTATLASNGTATCVYTPAAKGWANIVATYSGDTNNLGSAGKTKLDVCGCNNPTATVTLTADQTQLTYPGYTILHACVALSNQAYPQGTVSFYDGTTLLGVVTIQQSNDCVSLNIPKPGLNVGQHPITAVFTPLTGTGATSNTVVITVTAKTTTMEASCWNSSFPWGGDYQCDTNMDSGSKSGYMLYSLDGGAPVTLPLNSDGHAWFTIVKPSVGNHVVKIWYPAQGNYQGCGIPDNYFTVTPAPIQVQLVPNTYSAKVGTDFKFTASVTSWSAGPPNKDGFITFYDNNVVIGKKQVDAHGVAMLDAGCLTVGTHNITATYGGSKNYGTGSANTQVSVTR